MRNTAPAANRGGRYARAAIYAVSGAVEGLMMSR